jgi:hypothetical protein
MQGAVLCYQHMLYASKQEQIILKSPHSGIVMRIVIGILFHMPFSGFMGVPAMLWNDHPAKPAPAIFVEPATCMEIYVLASLRSAVAYISFRKIPRIPSSDIIDEPVLSIPPYMPLSGFMGVPLML